MSQVELTRLAPSLRLDGEKLANCVTHGAGFLLSVVGSVVLVAWAVAGLDVWRATGCIVYTASLIGVYAFSTLSHAVSDPGLRKSFRMLDQGFIYLLIAGTYTPFALAYLRTAPWWLFFALVWMLGLVGFLSKVFFAHRVEAVSVWLYIAMGWMLGLTVQPLLNAIPAAGLWWMLIGGVCYTAGTYFLVNDEGRSYFHAVWHLFVLAGSLCHFLTILFCVVLAA